MALRPYYKQVRFEHFRTFCQVARQESFAAAGKVLGLSRATVWQQIDTVERELGSKLLRRAGRGVELTDAGRVLLEMVRPTVAALGSLKESFRARIEGRGQVLRIVGMQLSELRTALLRFRVLHPQVRLTLVERRSSDVPRLVEDGACDLAFALVGPEMARSPLLHYEEVRERGFVLTTPRKHPLARKRRLQVADLVSYPLITFLQDNPLRRLVERGYERAGLLPRLQVVAETDSIETAEQCVSLGMGISIHLPYSGRKPTVSVQVRFLVEHFGALPLCLLWKKGAHLLPHVVSFVQLVKASPGSRE